MSDRWLQRLADVPVNYSTAVQPGEWVGIPGDIPVPPALREVYTAVSEPGGYSPPCCCTMSMWGIILQERGIRR